MIKTAKEANLTEVSPELGLPQTGSSLVAKYTTAVPFNDNLGREDSSSTVKEVRAVPSFPSDACAKLCDMTVTIHQKKATSYEFEVQSIIAQ